jgi:hypothetical protein
VNSVSTHGDRTADQVKKKLGDMKSDTRKKASAIRNHRMATGGGSPCKTSLSAPEELLLATINPQTISGIIEDGDSAIVANTPPPSGLEGSNDKTSADEEPMNERTNEVISLVYSTPKTNKVKRRRISTSSNQTLDSRITSAHAEYILEVER